MEKILHPQKKFSGIPPKKVFGIRIGAGFFPSTVVWGVLIEALESLETF